MESWNRAALLKHLYMALCFDGDDRSVHLAYSRSWSTYIHLREKKVYMCCYVFEFKAYCYEKLLPYIFFCTPRLENTCSYSGCCC
jgi:hypothetical protein